MRSTNRRTIKGRCTRRDRGGRDAVRIASRPPEILVQEPKGEPQCHAPEPRQRVALAAAKPSDDQLRLCFCSTPAPEAVAAVQRGAGPGSTGMATGAGSGNSGRSMGSMGVSHSSAATVSKEGSRQHAAGQLPHKRSNEEWHHRSGRRSQDRLQWVQESWTMCSSYARR
jgi:hypothetical protein